MVKKHIDDLKSRIERLEANPGWLYFVETIHE